MKSFWNIHYTYFTKLSAEQCLKNISTEPLVYGKNPHNPGRYCFSHISPTQFFITFCEGQFGKLFRTKYLVSLYKTDEGCLIRVEFQHEILGLPPMTDEETLSHFMKERFSAVRV